MPRDRWQPAGFGLIAWLLAGTAAAAQAPDVDRLYREGVEARHEGRFDEAIDRLSRAAAIAPQNADVAVQLGLALSVRKRYAEAEAAFRKALAVAPDYADARIGLARLAFWRGALDTASQELSKLTPEARGSADAHVLVRQVEEARRARAAAEHAKLMREGLERARRLRRENRASEATSLIAPLVAQEPRNVELRLELGLSLAAEKRYGEARRALDRALALDPSSSDIRLALARLALWTGNLNEASRLASEVMARDPDNMDAAVLQARIALLKGDAAGSESAFRAVLGRHPKSLDALIGLGDSLRAQLRDAQAREVYREALALDPTSSEAARGAAEKIRPRFRVDLNGSYSRLSGANLPWREGSARLAYIVSPSTTVGAGVQVSHRFGTTDTYAEGRIDQRLSGDLSAYGALGGTPDAHFLPRFVLAGGLNARLATGSGLLGGTFATVDVKYANYVTGPVRTANPGIVQYFFDGRLWLAAQFVNTLNESDHYLAGYIFRADLQMLDSLRLFAGYADAPESSEGITMETRSLFGGLVLDVDERTSLNLSAAYEQRHRAYDRTTVDLGLTLRY